MGLTRVRSYQEDVRDRLFRLAQTVRGSSIEFMGFHPLHATVGTGPKDVLISAGLHGNEPAGVYALLKLLEEGIFDLVHDYRFLIFPCVNIFGFEYDNRFSPQTDPEHGVRGMDINRQFRSGTTCNEASRIMTILSQIGRKFVCTIDLHETDPNWADEGFLASDNPHTFYMWENAPDRSIRVGDRVIREVRQIVPVCEWPLVYKDVNSGGVIYYPEGCGNQVYAQGTTLESFLGANYTPQAFTLETPCGWNMNQRVFAHHVALTTILELKRRV